MTHLFMIKYRCRGVAMNYLNAYLTYIEQRHRGHFIYEDFDFQYHLTGQGEETILVLLESSVFKTEAYFLFLRILESRYKVLVIHDLKPLFNHEKIIDGIAHLLRHLSLDQIHIIGMNHGGSLALTFAKKYRNALSSLILYHSIIHTHFMNEEALSLKKFFLKTIDELEELRKTMSLNQIKMALLEQIHQFIERLDDIDHDEANDYFEYLLSLYQESDEQYQMKRIKDFLLSPSYQKEEFVGLTEKSYILYGDDEDPFYGPAMLEVAMDLLDNPKIDYLEMNRFEIILKPHKLAHKVFQFLKK